MTPREEDPLHPIAPVLRTDPARAIQVPARVLRAVRVPERWRGPERRRRRRAPPEPPPEPPETYDEHGVILHPHEEDTPVIHLDLEA
ncbi:MAG TPA: hypothetical protein VJ623_00555 [Holophagaceae bacterium]|nr:hypothetical protein [Holophagaceae bacterium]